MVRNTSFFEWKEDPYMALFMNRTPEFVETDYFGYQVMENFTDLKPSQNGEVVGFNFWTWFKHMPWTDGEHVLEIVNVGALGVIN